MVPYSCRANPRLHFANVSTRRRDFVFNVGVMLLKPRDRAVTKRKLTCKFTSRIHISYDLSEQMTQKNVHHVSVRGGFKTQPPVDQRFRPVPGGCHCLEQ